MPIYHAEPGDDSPKAVGRQSYQSFACGLLHFGPVALYCSRRQLDADLQTLVAEGFDVRRMQAGRWGADVSAHDDLKATLEFPEFYGGNLNAMSDCLRDVKISDEGGLAVVLEDFDDFAKRAPDFARGVLDVFAHGSRLLQIFAKTLIILVHTKDPDSDFGPLGAVTAWWNLKEFVRSNRGKL